tara:strand:- start:43 stop:663 length:621 start_codon:yes stop_codon:yes gene_type:complete
MNFEDEAIPPEHQDFIDKGQYDNFIGIYTDAVPRSFCNWLKEYMDNSSLCSFDSSQVKDKRISMEAFSPKEAAKLMNYVNNCLVRYSNEYPYIKGSNYISANVNLQKTSPTEGYHVFHSENHAWLAVDRTLAWMVYLNTVPEGGETEWLYQKKRVSPEKGTVVIWPGGFTHLHRGNPPMTDKYIATGWYQACSGIDDKFIKSEGLQ